jgi:hypothetical protein
MVAAVVSVPGQVGAVDAETTMKRTLWVKRPMMTMGH